MQAEIKDFVSNCSTCNEFAHNQQKETMLPNKLLEPSVVTGVVERLQHQKKQAKSYYDRSACDLPDLNIGEKIRMQPLKQKNPALWKVGTCLQKVAPRSYLVNVDGSTKQSALEGGRVNCHTSIGHK
ncbi:uncharacterized protein LOC115147874 [Tachysurus ichikawai]